MRVLLCALLATAACACVLAAPHPRHSQPHAPVPPPRSDANWMSFCRNPQSNSSLVPQQGIVDGCDSFGFFNDDIATTGWSYLGIETNPDNTPAAMGYAAGFAEGYLAAARIEQSIVNTFQSTFTNGTVPQVVYDYIRTQQAWIQQQSDLDPSNVYWSQVLFMNRQIAGIVDGCAAASPPVLISLRDMIALNMIAEASDIQAAGDKEYRDSIDVLSFGDLKRVRATMEKHSHCSALIRLSPDGQDMFSAHTTWTGYTNMLRTYKSISADFPGAAAKTMQFSGYPGCIASGDDYYQSSAGLIVIETTNSVANMSLYEYVTPQSVPTFIRCVVATRMADSGAQWNEIYSQHNSGTYNNQWMISDSKQFTAGEPARAGTLWIVSQIPGLILSRDVTDVLSGQGFWPSYNIPYFPELWKLLGYESLVQQYGEEGEYLFSYASSFRALIFARDAPNVKTIADMQRLMQQNQWQTDPLSRGSADLAVASRMDLSSGPLSTASASGAIDAKLSSASWMKAPAGDMRVLTKSGPTCDTQAPFQWSTSAFNDQPHVGMPDTFDFDWIQYTITTRPTATAERISLE